MKVQYIARIKSHNHKTIEQPFSNPIMAKGWLDIKFNGYENAIGEIEERRRNNLGLMVESTIKYYYKT